MSNTKRNSTFFAVKFKVLFTFNCFSWFYAASKLSVIIKSDEIYQL